MSETESHLNPTSNTTEHLLIPLEPFLKQPNGGGAYVKAAERRRY